MQGGEIYERSQKASFLDWGNSRCGDRDEWGDLVSYGTSSGENGVLFSFREKVVDRQALQMSLVKRYGKDAAIAWQYFDGPLSYAPEVWFLDGKVVGVWVITPKKPTHLVVNLSREFMGDIQRHPLLVQRWIEGLFQTLREMGDPLRSVVFWWKEVIKRWW